MEILEVSNVRKHYGDAVALDDASVSFRAGEVHAIIGENGAGKSTLVKVLTGMVLPEQGEVRVEGEPLPLFSPRDSRRVGIYTAFQELSLIPNLTVAENLLVTELPLGVIRSRDLNAKAAKILADWDVTDLDPSVLVSRLPLSAKQRLEIVRAFSHDPKILILDEPTAALPDTSWLFRHVRAAKARGAAVIYISHKLGEISEICDVGTIMRNGRIVGDFDAKNFDHNGLISAMIGRSINLAFPPRLAPLDPQAPILLEARGIEVGNRVRGVDVTVRAGEIVGVAGLEGQGQRDLFYGLAGAGEVTGGEIVVEGQSTKFSSPRQALRSGPGIALVPEERKREGIFPDLLTEWNISVPLLSKLSPAGFMQRKRERAVTAEAGRSAHMPEVFLEREVGRLSGGNQQKSILARTSLTGARVLLMFDPTRGIDPSAKLEVYGSLRQAAAEGAAILLYSTEIPELVGLCDRIEVMYRGRFVREFAGSEMNEDAIMQTAMGHGSNADEQGVA